MQKKAKKISKFANNQFDFILCITVLLLLALGIIMVLSASAPSSLATTGNSYTIRFCTRWSCCNDFFIKS